MKALVLGGSGFIGSHLVDKLLEANQKVRVFDCAPEQYRSLRSEVEYVFGDVRNTDRLTEALIGIDYVVHCFSATVPKTADLDPRRDVEQNLLPSLSLLELMNKMSVKKMFYISSGGCVYGIPTIIPTPETHQLNPLNSYGVVKVATENYLGFFARSTGMKVTIIRPSNPYGPRHRNIGIQGVVNTFLNQIRQNRPIQIWGDGSIIRDFIYIEDLADLCVSIILSGRTGTFNGGSGHGISIFEVLKDIIFVTGSDVPITYTSANPVDVPKSVLDMTKVREEIGWKPKYTFAEGVEATWKWVQERC